MSSQKKVSSGNTTPSGLAGLASPLNDQQINLLQQISDLSPQQLAWVSGYFWLLKPATPKGLLKR